MCLILVGPSLSYRTHKGPRIKCWQFIQDFSRFKQLMASCGLVAKMHTTPLQCAHFSSSWRSFLHVIPPTFLLTFPVWLFSHYPIRQSVLFILLKNIWRSFFKIKQTKQLSERHHDTSRSCSPPPLFIIFLNSRLCRILIKTFTNRSQKKKTVSVLCSPVKGRRVPSYQKHHFLYNHTGSHCCHGDDRLRFYASDCLNSALCLSARGRELIWGGIHVCRYAAITAIRTGLCCC